jgi:hypothetical protein
MLRVQPVQCNAPFEPHEGVQAWRKRPVEGPASFRSRGTVPHAAYAAAPSAVVQSTRWDLVTEMNTWPYWHLVLPVLLFVLYFLPTIIALLGHRLTAPIVVVNLILGWTLIGWVVALVVICWPDRANPRRYPRNDLHQR